MEYDGPRGTYDCKDLRDGEVWSMHTDTMRDIRSDGFNYTDTSGTERHAGKENTAYIKCVFRK